ncbi:glycosyltransferase family 39 protein [Galbibacter sp. BG1]|uniref:ArnT family glycosyltransferase n=1 Tax=Galbibacter sp. BG1 TaxID=1170699 RepID=UPI0015B9D44E|nr:glycosyltransferase family 39 protein [Galbibacter sp. BG1]QLE02957.1 glycosyltransferase family 39 protein [Galbibacter sp. BG1]
MLNVAILCFVAIIIIAFLKAAPEWEDAEQAYYSQWFRLGYNDQPPLYTWIQILVNKVLGLNRLSLAALRAFWFAGTLMMLYKLSYKIHKNINLSALTTFLVCLIPVFIDFNFRRLTHTSMMCFMCVSLYYWFYRLREDRSLLNYIAFGYIIGLGLLTKYNFVLLLPVFMILPFLDEKTKIVYQDIKILLSFLACLLIIAPHLYWLIDNAAFLSEITHSMRLKTKSNNYGGVPVLTPALAFGKSFINLFLPLLLLFTFQFFRKKLALKKVIPEWFEQAFWCQFIFALICFVVINSSKVSGRWLLPLFLPFLVLLTAKLQPVNIRIWNKWSSRLFYIVILFQIIRTPAEGFLGINSSVQHSFERLNEKLNKDFSNKSWVLPDVTYAGSIKLYQQDRIIYAADDFTLPKNELDSLQTVYVLKEKKLGFVLKDSIIGFGAEKEDLFLCLKLP